jgi:NitT/TauT family transport system substrate-binding protein
MIKKVVFFIIILLLFTSCEYKSDKKLKISVTTWIGYTPLFYAKEKKWLEPLNIKLLNVVSLSENMYLYKAGNSDAYVGTQYEYNLLSQENKSLLPIMMFDKSYGGDIVLGNHTIKEFQNTQERIDVYLEMDSVNSILLQDFIKIHKLENKKINYINEDQAYIASLNYKNLKKPTLIITYTPYDNILKKHGLKELSSTKDGLDLLVVDAMFTNKKVFMENRDKFLAIKNLIDKAIISLKKNPKEFFDTIKAYLPNTNYEEFKSSLNTIVWINKNMSEQLLNRLRDNNFPTRDIIK